MRGFFFMPQKQLLRDAGKRSKQDRIFMFEFFSSITRVSSETINILIINLDLWAHSFIIWFSVTTYFYETNMQVDILYLGSTHCQIFESSDAP